MSKKGQSWFVYWLFDERCVCPWRHGYIGVCNNLPHRLFNHRRNRRFPPNWDWKILLTAPTEAECHKVERDFRPRHNIGWNQGIGGYRSGAGLAGVPKSTEQKEKMRAAALRRYADPAERLRTQKAVKDAFKTIDRSGANNGRYGYATSEATKEKIRFKIIERGGVAGDRNPMFGRKRSRAEKKAISEGVKRSLRASSPSN